MLQNPKAATDMSAAFPDLPTTSGFGAITPPNSCMIFGACKKHYSA